VDDKRAMLRQFLPPWRTGHEKPQGRAEGFRRVRPPNQIRPATPQPIPATQTPQDLLMRCMRPLASITRVVRADERLRTEFPGITLPVLILHGTADKAAKASGSQVFFGAAGSTDKTLRLYEGHVHDLLNDVDKDIVMAGIKDWIGARLSGSNTRDSADRQGKS
jgi:alpha-beta hydrolase superfamily lysophospholipase